MENLEDRHLQHRQGEYLIPKTVREIAALTGSMGYHYSSPLPQGLLDVPETLTLQTPDLHKVLSEHR